MCLCSVCFFEFVEFVREVVDFGEIVADIDVEFGEFIIFF